MNGRDERIEPEDPTQEGSAAVVEGWFGQEAASDADLADELLAQAAGDEDEAAATFDERSHHAEAERGEKENRSAG